MSKEPKKRKDGRFAEPSLGSPLSIFTSLHVSGLPSHSSLSCHIFTSFSPSRAISAFSSLLLPYILLNRRPSSGRQHRNATVSDITFVQIEVIITLELLCLIRMNKVSKVIYFACGVWGWTSVYWILHHSKSAPRCRQNSIKDQSIGVSKEQYINFL